MRAFGFPAVSLAVALSVYGCAAAVRQEAPRAELREEVTLSASCRSDTVVFSARPWQAVTETGRSVRWVVDSTSDVHAFVLGSVDDWPFEPGPPLYPGKGSAARSPRVRNGAKRDNRYTVIFHCPGGRKVIIDPDIIVRDGI